MTPSAWRDMVVLGVLGALLAACDSGTSKKTPPPPPSTFSLTVVISGSGEGSVTSGAQIACQTGATNGCAAEYDEGAQVTLTASPDAGSAFAGWSGDCTGAGSTCQVTMSRAMSVTATFDQIQLTAPLVSSISQGEESQGQVQALSINHYIAAEGIYPSSGGSMNSTGLPYLGQVMLFAGAVVPGGWLRCDGSLLPISGNEALFSLIGTLYGGDGATTFALPDLRDGVAMGVGTISNPAAVPTFQPPGHDVRRQRHDHLRSA